MADKKKQIPNDVELEKMNLDPIDLDTHELDLIEPGKNAEESMAKVGNEANEKADADLGADDDDSK